MAVNKEQHFKSSAYTTADRYAVTNSAGDVFASDATYTRDLMRLTCINVNASSRDLTLYWSDGTNHDIVMVITIAGNAGQSTSVPAVRLLNNDNPDNRVPGVQQDAFGNYYLRIPPGKKLRALASATSSLVLLFTLESFQGS